MSNQTYMLMHMEPKAEWNDRKIIHAVSHPDMTMETYREMFPDQFEEPGHYSLVTVVDRCDIQKKKS